MKQGMIRISYLMLMLVMGGRTALFASNFDNLITLRSGDSRLTAIAVLLALSLILAVEVGAYHRGVNQKGSNAYRRASRVMVGAASLDGLFNVTEAFLLATETGIYSAYQPPLLWLTWLSTGLLGIGPTLLTIWLAELAGELDKRDDHRRKPIWQVLLGVTNDGQKTKVAAQLTAEVEHNPTMEEHVRTVVKQLTPGEHFRRADVEQWVDVSKQHAVNIVNYGKDHGVFNDVKRGVYAYKNEEVRA
jgi:hypothetical protein